MTEEPESEPKPVPEGITLDGDYDSLVVRIPWIPKIAVVAASMLACGALYYLKIDEWWGWCLVGGAALLGLLGETRLIVKNGHLIVDWLPVWIRWHEIPLDQVRQLFVEETENRWKLNRYDEPYNRRRRNSGDWLGSTAIGSDGHTYGVTRRYDLSCALHDGRRVTLMRGVRSKGLGRYLERIVEEQAGIDDDFVAGEAR